VLLDFHNGGRGWRMSLGALVQATLLGLVLVLPLLWADRLNGSNLPVWQPAPIPLGDPYGKRDIKESGGGKQREQRKLSDKSLSIRLTDDTVRPTQGPVIIAGPDLGPGPFNGEKPYGRPDGERGSWLPPGDPLPDLNPPRDPATKKPIRISTLRPPRILRRVNPTYPPIALKARIEGDVVMDALLGEDGRVREITVKSGHPQLIYAAREAVAQWVYEPTLLNGEPYPVLLEITVRFSLSR
ncbi:MAG: energy transducer TonB, partial [Candidatus Acidiferrales bacterium]